MSGKSREQCLSEAQTFWDESLPLRAEKRITGANAHNARCWMHKYREVCGQFGNRICVCGLNAKWYRDVLTIFANGHASTIDEAQNIHSEAIRKRNDGNCPRRHQ